ncbi:YraN family protein [Actinophytocola sp.]|uniref:YraN family protein n=1 Tax=Actinophytocola sp. TaxID=1872138 RepID=UPI002ED32B09
MTADTTPARPEHLRTGERGEALAAIYLEQHGLTVLSRNWRCPEGELDLVLTDGRTLVVCEVKTRTSDHYGTPGEAVDDAKAGRIRRLTRRWRAEFGVRHVDTRYDIVAILWPPGEKPQINHLKGVL